MKNLKGYYKPKKKVDKRVIKLKTLNPDEKPATEKQIGYILSLLNENKLRGFFHKERDGKRLSLKQASNLIDCLKEGILFKFKDVDMWKNKMNNISNDRMNEIHDMKTTSILTKNGYRNYSKKT